jgi:hypothetical protein
LQRDHLVLQAAAFEFELGDPVAELLDAGAISQQVRDTSVYARRPLTFYWQFEPAVWERPYWSTGAGQFWSTLVAVTYADYSAYHFSPRTEAPPPRGWTEVTLARAGRSVLGGTVIGVITAGAWLVCLVLALWRREAPWAAMLVVSALAIVGQLYFATKYPVDHYGVIKGTYIQFGAAPLYVCFGLAVSRRGVLGRGACRRTAARNVQRGRDQHERGGDLEMLHDGNTHNLAQEAVVIRESKGWGTRC